MYGSPFFSSLKATASQHQQVPTQKRTSGGALPILLANFRTACLEPTDWEECTSLRLFFSWFWIFRRSSEGGGTRGFFLALVFINFLSIGRPVPNFWYGGWLFAVFRFFFQFFREFYLFAFILCSECHRHGCLATSRIEKILSVFLGPCKHDFLLLFFSSQTTTLYTVVIGLSLWRLSLDPDSFFSLSFFET